MTEEVKSSDQIEMERRSEELERRICRFKNIDNEAFTHSFRGISITIQAHEEHILRLPEADHLAFHLARKILSREAKKNAKPGEMVKLWTPEKIEELKKQIVFPIDTQEATSPMTAEEARKRDVEALNKEFGKKEETPSPVPETPTETPTVTKKDIIAELKKRGQNPDISKTKEELMKDLLELEAQGK